MSEENQRFSFIPNNYSKHLICKICQSLFTDPIRLHRCAHTFCQKCLQQNNKKKTTCPICLTKITAKQDDILAKKLVDGLLVRCLSQDCTWKGSLDQFNKFHNENCSLKKGGLDAWLKNVMQCVGGTLDTQKYGDQIPPKQDEPKDDNKSKKVNLPERLDNNELKDISDDEGLQFKKIKHGEYN